MFLKLHYDIIDFAKKRNGMIKLNKRPILGSCTLCPRECGADRFVTTGFCGSPAEPVVARAALHMWEEPCISGSEGSGAVFFCGCQLRCVYCQNHSISNSYTGKKITDERLAEIFLELQRQNANNINLVTPTQYTLSIINAIQKAREEGLSVPVIYNCSGYEKPQTMDMLKGYIDIYLTDFKYMSPYIAKKYSCASDYPDKAMQAVEHMFRQTGKPVFNKKGIMQKGVIVRHLMLPECENDSKNIISYLYHKYQDDIFISIMNQYTPMPNAASYPELNRRITPDEYDKIIDYAVSLGIENAFIQDGETASESFIPPFDNSGI